MAVRLVSSGDGRALNIRDHLLPLVRQNGTLEVQRDTIRVISWQVRDLRVEHWTPFYELGADEASSPGYRHAIEQQRASPSLPYGIDIWIGTTKVLCLLWADDGRHEIVGFTRGEWEVDALII